MKIISAYTVVIKSIENTVDDYYIIEYIVKGETHYTPAHERDLYNEDTIREVIAKDIKKREIETEKLQDYRKFIGKKINVVA